MIINRNYLIIQYTSVQVTFIIDFLTLLSITSDLTRSIDLTLVVD
jgi:hypothetical protein